MRRSGVASFPRHQVEERSTPSPPGEAGKRHPPITLQMPQDVLLLHTLGSGDRPQNRVQGSDAQRSMIGNGNPVLPGIAGFENDVASLLIQPALVEVFAGQFDQLRPAQIPRQFHATASTSSRTRCSRITEGLGWSKKNALTASLTLARNSSHVSPWVKMSCERH